MHDYLHLSPKTALDASDAARALLAWGKIARRLDRARSLGTAPLASDVIEHRYLGSLVRALGAALALPDLEGALGWAATGKVAPQRAWDLTNLARLHETAEMLFHAADMLEGDYFRAASPDAQPEHDAVRAWFATAHAEVGKGFVPIARALAAHWGWRTDAKVTAAELIGRHGLLLLTDAERSSIIGG